MLALFLLTLLITDNYDDDNGRFLQRNESNRKNTSKPEHNYKFKQNSDPTNLNLTADLLKSNELTDLQLDFQSQGVGVAVLQVVEQSQCTKSTQCFQYLSQQCFPTLHSNILKISTIVSTLETLPPAVAILSESLAFRKNAANLANTSIGLSLTPRKTYIGLTKAHGWRQTSPLVPSPSYKNRKRCPGHIDNCVRSSWTMKQNKSLQTVQELGIASTNFSFFWGVYTKIKKSQQLRKFQMKSCVMPSIGWARWLLQA